MGQRATGQYRTVVYHTSTVLGRPAGAARRPHQAHTVVQSGRDYRPRPPPQDVKLFSSYGIEGEGEGCPHVTRVMAVCACTFGVGGAPRGYGNDTCAASSEGAAGARRF